jgi:hypothetical protein
LTSSLTPPTRGEKAVNGLASPELENDSGRGGRGEEMRRAREQGRGGEGGGWKRGETRGDIHAQEYH